MPPLRAALLGFAIVAVLGYALNDAGVVVPGLMLGVFIVVLVPLLVEPRSPPEARTRTADRRTPSETTTA